MFTRWVFLADMPIYAPFSEIHMVISATKKYPGQVTQNLGSLEEGI